MLNDYNTIREPLVLKEYGRNVQKLVHFIQSVDDKEKRNNYCQALTELMKLINPSMKEYFPEENQKLWDDLHIIANFKLDIDSPYPVPPPESLTKRPEPLGYQSRIPKFKHYGYNIQLLVEQAMVIEDEKDREAATIYLGRIMRSFANIWNKGNVDETVIIQNLKELSNGRLDIDVQKVKENNLFEPFYKERERPRTNKHRKSNASYKRRRN